MSDNVVMETPRTRTTPAEMLERVAFVEEALLKEGWTSGLRYRIEKKYGVCRRTAERYYQMAMEQARVVAQAADREAERAAFVGRLRTAQAKALALVDDDDKDRVAALRAYSGLMNLESRILGLQEPIEVNINARFSAMPMEDLVRLIEAGGGLQLLEVDEPPLLIDVEAVASEGAL